MDSKVTNQSTNQPHTKRANERTRRGEPARRPIRRHGWRLRPLGDASPQPISQPASQPMNLESWQFVAVQRTYCTVCSRRVRDALRWPGADLITYARRGAKRDAAVRPSIERIGNSTQGKEANCRARFLIGRDRPGAISGAKRRHTKKGCRSFVIVRGRATIFLFGWIWRNARWEGAGGEGGISGAVWSRATRDGGWMDRGAGVLSCEIYYPARARDVAQAARGDACVCVCVCVRAWCYSLSTW